MDEQKSDAQSEILIAAKKVFLSKGYNGATMRDIAQEAGVNLAMVNYYFRSKERLFDMIFIEASNTLFALIEVEMMTNKSIFEKIEIIVSIYIDSITSNPLIPSFVFAELTRDPQKLLSKIEGFSKIAKVFSGMDTQIAKEVKEGIMRPIKAYELYLNIVSMTIFPYIARPIIDHIVEHSNITNDEFTDFLTSRKNAISRFIIDAIKLK